MNDITTTAFHAPVATADPTAENDDAPVLFLHGIGRTYNQGTAPLEVLKNAELALWPGQSVALVAPSGAGKSTLLHVAGLLEHPDAGEVYVDKIPTSRLSESERTRIRPTDLGFVYQFLHILHDVSTVVALLHPQ